jgi:hypothetical protein
MSTYLGLPNYTNNLRRLGWTEDDIDAPSDALVDAIVAWGDLDAVVARVRAHLDAGADHVCLQVLTGDRAALPMAEWRDLAAATLSSDARVWQHRPDADLAAPPRVGARRLRVRRRLPRRAGAASVPSCPDWRANDLLWHLTEVHDFWCTVVDRRTLDPTGIDEPPRPPDDQLESRYRDGLDRLLGVLAQRTRPRPSGRGRRSGGRVRDPPHGARDGRAPPRRRTHRRSSRRRRARAGE